MRIPLINLLACIMVFCCSVLAAGEVDWSGIQVEVSASHPVTTSQKLIKEENGFHRLAITFSNEGKSVLNLDKITIRIPLADQLTENLDVVYGGSCMGQTPVLREKIATHSKLSSSQMYQMVRTKDDGYLFAGSLSWRIFMPTFTIENGAFVISSMGQGKQLKPGETIAYEQIVLHRMDNWIDLLNQFGSAIAKHNNIGKLKTADFKGWATWDYFGYKFSSKDIQDNSEIIKRIDPKANLIQIDAGWYSIRGDYKERPDLVGGMKGIAERIKADGMTPGIWIDGFRANTASEVCQKHPEYFLHDQDGKMIVEVRRPEGIDRDRIYFDYSHPGARAHIAACIRSIVEDFGFPYVKIDFMRFGLNDEILKNKPHVKVVKAHDPTLSDVERMRLGLQAMREALGPETYLLGCSAVFGPCIGFVDGMRTGGDINPRYEAFPQRCLANLGHFYLNGKVFNVDADYLVFREAADEDEKVSEEDTKHGGTMTMNEARMWADFSKLFGNCRLSGDHLVTLRSERQALVKEVFQHPPADETVPLDLWKKATHKADAFELILSRKRAKIFLGVFNWNDSPRDYQLKEFGKNEAFQLKGRHSVILPYEGSDSFLQLCEKLQSR